MARVQIVQVSRCVEELMQACYELLEAREQEDQATRMQQLMVPPKTQMEQVLLCHRQANGSCERMLLDLVGTPLGVRSVGVHALMGAAERNPADVPEALEKQQQAQVLLDRLKTQGTFTSGSEQLTSTSDSKATAAATNHLPVQRLAGLKEYEDAMKSCLLRTQ